MDFYGMNYYTSQFARHRDEPALETDFMGNMDELQETSKVYQSERKVVCIGSGQPQSFFGST
jgi:hypothetical protein